MLSLGALLALPVVLQGVRAAGNGTSNTCQPQPCNDIHVFVVRGTNEAYPGISLPVPEAICADWDDCGWSSVRYPASFRPDYCSSVEAGVASLSKTVGEYGERCPESKLVLTGFSQGGHVVGDYLGGGGGPISGCEQEASPALDPESAVGQQIIAALMWGSPRHSANQTYNVLVGERFQSGAPREGEQLKSLNLWSDKLRDYCNMDDPACAKGTSWTAHENYFELYHDDAAQFVKFQIC